MKGKTYSIIGDSVTTYAEHIPAGYQAFYPDYSAALRGVDDTWWKRMEAITGMTLLKNCSWAGKGMCGDSASTTNAAAGCSTARIAALSDGATKPDVVIVFDGINDFNDSTGLGTTIGTWTADESIPAEGNILTFREAYALGITKVMAAYPNAEVYCCTLLEITDPSVDKDGDGSYPVRNAHGETIADYNAAIREIAEGLGARLIDVHACGIGYFNASGKLTDGVHPTAIGMDLIGCYVASAILGQTSYRYGHAPYSMRQGISDAAFLAQTEKLTLATASGMALFTNMFDDLDGMVGSPIYGVRMRFGTAGNFYVGRATFRSETEPEYATATIVQTLTVSTGNVGKVMTFMFDDPVRLKAGEKLFFGSDIINGTVATARPYYGAGGHKVALSLNSGLSFSETEFLSGVDHVI